MKYVLVMVFTILFANCSNLGIGNKDDKQECDEYGGIIYILANDPSVDQDMVTYLMYDWLFNKCHNYDAE